MRGVSKVTLSQLYTYCSARNLPFACYRLPGNKTVTIVAQKDSGAQRFQGAKDSNAVKGFLFAPFREDKTLNTVLIRADILCDERSLPKLDFAKPVITVPVKEKPREKVKETSRKGYENLVKKIKKGIQKGDFSKVIAARVIKKRMDKGFNPVDIFTRLCKAYPHAFVSMVFTKEHGLWIGASPEILLSVNKGGFKTYALAGTRANTKQNLKTAWGNKEKEEHTIVSNYIADTFKGITKQKPLVKKMETVTAGNLLHLRTTFHYKDLPPSLWTKAVAALHPTPAVAGLPKEKAINFILKNEKSPRSFYSGYLGPVNIKSEINLFVNLRCMHILKNKLAIYVGCGITGNSVPSEEWRESEIKSQTLLRVL